MEGKDMPPPNLSSFYMQYRGLSGPNPGPTQQSLHGPLPSLRPNPITASGLQIPHTHIGPAFQMEPHPPANQMPPHGEPVVKRKRGRPRKYGPEGKLPLRPSPLSPSTGGHLAGGALISVPGEAGKKKKRGRPPGTGRKQQLASLGEWFAGTAGTGFTPHLITVKPDEDVAAKIKAFSNQSQRAICVLSANGPVSAVALCQLESSGVVTYEGLFEILSLCGSYLPMENGGSKTWSEGLTIALSGPDGRVLGGVLGGVLIAASTIQVVVGSFSYGKSKSKSKVKSIEESGDGGSHPHTSGKQDVPVGMMSNQNLTPSLASGAWAGSGLMDMRTSNIDINLGRM